MSWSYSTVRAPNRSASCRIRKKPMVDDTLYPDYLMHHGIKGQQWGIRRYQNEDGTLTEEGKLRYNDSSPESKKWDKRETSYLTDEELNRRNLRLQREQQYRNLTTTDKEREREQLKKDFKKKVLTAALITPVVALAGIAGKKYIGKAVSFVSKNGKRLLNRLFAMPKTKSRLENGPNTRYSFEPYSRYIPSNEANYWTVRYHRPGGILPKTYRYRPANIAPSENGRAMGAKGLNWPDVLKPVLNFKKKST